MARLTTPLDQLTADEKLALVALLKLVVRADGELSKSEVRELNEVARQLGPEQFHSLVGTARERFRTRQDAENFAKTIERAPAQRMAGISGGQ